MTINEQIKGAIENGAMTTFAVDVVAGATTAVAAAATDGRRHYVVGYSLLINGNQRCELRDGATARIVHDAESAVYIEPARMPDYGYLMRTAANTALNFVTDAAVRVSGYIQFVTV